MRALKRSFGKLAQETSPRALFPDPPLIRFIPERDVCDCGGRLLVHKTRRKTVWGMTGPFIAHETVLQCSDCSSAFTSDSLLDLVQSRCNVAYDVMVFVGRSLFQRFRTAREVQDELLDRNVSLSLSEIDYLGRKFITYLAAGHRQATPRIRQAMQFNGGYILHLDAAHDGDAPALMTGMDGLSKIVLANVKLPSENADYIIPFLQEIKAQYGKPIACVHDMGKGILKAVAKVFPGIPDFICHFHFLRDIGKDFLGPAYQELRLRLRYHAATSRLNELVREARQRLYGQDTVAALPHKGIESSASSIASAYSLSLWCLYGKQAGDGYGFPFDRPLLEFAERILSLHGSMPEILDMFSLEDRKENQILLNLAKQVSCIAKDVYLLGKAVRELRWRCTVFDRLRKVMRIAPPDGSNGLKDEGDSQAFVSIRQGVEQFRKDIDSDSIPAGEKLSLKMAEQIDKYWNKLFADPIKVSTKDEMRTIYPSRTNNILEHLFRKVRRDHRRKTGNNAMRRTLQAMLADTPLVKNLNNPDYMEILLNGKNSLEELFSELGKAHPETMTETSVDSDRILPGFRRLMKIKNLPEHILKAGQTASH